MLDTTIHYFFKKQRHDDIAYTSSFDFFSQQLNNVEVLKFGPTAHNAKAHYLNPTSSILAAPP